jgi:hypothetical protein
MKQSYFIDLSNLLKSLPKFAMISDETNINITVLPMSPQQSGPYQSQSLNQVTQIYQNLVDKCTRTYRYLQYNSTGVMQLMLVPIFALWAGVQNISQGISQGWQNLLGKKVLNLPYAENFDLDNNSNNIDNNTQNLNPNIVDHDINFNHDLNDHFNQNHQKNLDSVKKVKKVFNPINSINPSNLSSKKTFVSAVENSVKNWVYPLMIGVTSLVPILEIKPAEKALVNIEPPLPSSMAVFTENPSDLAVNNQNNSETKISYNDQFLEAHFVPMGYVKHPLELVLEWVDKIIYFVEQLIVEIVNFYRS